MRRIREHVCGRRRGSSWEARGQVFADRGRVLRELSYPANAANCPVANGFLAQHSRPSMEKDCMRRQKAEHTTCC